VLLNLSRERYFCRYLCPAGALFGLLGRWSLVKVRVDKEKCTECRSARSIARLRRLLSE